MRSPLIMSKVSHAPFAPHSKVPVRTTSGWNLKCLCTAGGCRTKTITDPAMTQSIPLWPVVGDYRPRLLRNITGGGVRQLWNESSRATNVYFMMNFDLSSVKISCFSLRTIAWDVRVTAFQGDEAHASNALTQQVERLTL